MARDFTLIDTKQEYRLVRNRIYVAGMIMFLLGLSIIARVFYLQVIQHEHFTTLSQHNRVRLEPLPPIRGLIFSRDDVLLADNRPSFSLEIIPEEVTDLDRLIHELTGLIRVDKSDIERFRSQLDILRRFKSVTLRFNLSDEEVATLSVNRHLYPGVDVVARLNRYYPLEGNTAHVVGYVGLIDEQEMQQLEVSNYSGTTHIGKLGVEKAYEDLLHGRVGYQQVEVNAQGRMIRVLDRTPPVAGRNIHLSLDVSLQNIAVEALAGRRGAIVAIDPRDGGVLALVSSPGYDPNLFVNGIDHKSYNRLLHSKDAPLLNRALQGQYPPGSTIKPFIGWIALNEGVRTTEDETWCPGWYTLPGKTRKYRDWKKGGHGHTNLRQAIAQSCDVFFYSVAMELGIDTLSNSLNGFGFGIKTGIDIGGERAGLVANREWKRRTMNQNWYPGETVNMGIGQGSTLVTPMQLALATAALANRGRVVRPHLLRMSHDPATDVSEPYRDIHAPSEIHARNDAYWQEIVDDMAEVVHGPRGTARAYGEGATYRFAGKTGTAQVIGMPQDEDEAGSGEVPEEFRDHALFIAFAPLDQPTIAIAIVVENGEHGSTTAAPIARRMLDHYLGEEVQDQG